MTKKESPTDQDREKAAGYTTPQPPLVEGPDTPGIAKNPVQDLNTIVSQMQNSLRQQHMTAEQQLGGSLAQSFSSISDAQKMNQIQGLVSQLSQFTSGGTSTITTNLPQVKQVLQQMSEQLAAQNVATSLQIEQSLQQAVSSLSQAQSATYTNIALRELDQMTKRASDVISWIETPSRMVQ
jgi:glutamyl-tRNA reductase